MSQPFRQPSNIRSVRVLAHTIRIILLVFLGLLAIIGVVPPDTFDPQGRPRPNRDNARGSVSDRIGGVSGVGGGVSDRVGGLGVDEGVVEERSAGRTRELKRKWPRWFAPNMSSWPSVVRWIVGERETAALFIITWVREFRRARRENIRISEGVRWGEGGERGRKEHT